MLTAPTTAVVDVLPTSLSDLPDLPADLAPRPTKRPSQPTPKPKHLIGTANSIVHAQYDTDNDRWVYHCIGPAGITDAYLSSYEAKTAYKSLAQNPGV